jgi:hypothetical protein
LLSRPDRARRQYRHHDCQRPAGVRDFAALELEFERELIRERTIAGAPTFPRFGLLSVIFRLIEARRNEIRSQLPLFEAKSTGCPPRSVELVALH